MEIPEFEDLIAFSQYIHAAPPLDRDFDVNRIEDYRDHLSATHIPAFRHRFFSVCLGEQLDMELNVGYYHRKPEVPFLLFKSPYQVISWNIQPGLKRGWHLLFTENFLLRNRQLTDIVHEFPFLQMDRAIPFGINDSERDALAKIFRQIREEYQSGLPDKFELVASYIRILLLHIRRLYEKYVGTDDGLVVWANQSDTVLYNRFRSLLDQQVTAGATDADRSVSFFAGELSVHPSYLNAVVKRVTGESTLTLVHERILGEAKTLLLQSALTVKEIAYRLAFREPTHFGTFFKKYTGQTPAQFRGRA
ncbi:MAG TPA: helix-turn-helix domain-containing protein [Puia sp.]